MKLCRYGDIIASSQKAALLPRSNESFFIFGTFSLKWPTFLDFSPFFRLSDPPPALDHRSIASSSPHLFHCSTTTATQKEGPTASQTAPEIERNSLMSDLKDSVKRAIASYVESKKDTHTPVDVLRMIRDQASLLYERQLICDALDADPMQQLDQVTAQVKRIQTLMKVISATRTVTLDGYCRNDAVVEWKRDDRMKDVDMNVQLTFHYERRLKHESEDQNSRILYTIDIAKDYGQKERLLVIEVFALGEGPSIKPAEPLDEDEWEDTDDVTMDASVEPEESCAKPGDAQQQDKDRYAAYMDPDVLNDFSEWTQLNMNEAETFFFLMTFPFYEHEWDLVDYGFHTIFGGEEDMDDEHIEVADINSDAASGSVESFQEQDDDSDL